MIHPLRLLLSCACLSFAALASAADAPPPFKAPTQFTVDQTIVDASGATRRVRLYRDNDKFRTEVMVDGALSESDPVVIERTDKNLTHLLMRGEPNMVSDHMYSPSEYPSPFKDAKATWTKSGADTFKNAPCDVYAVVSMGQKWTAFVHPQTNAILHIENQKKTERIDLQRWQLSAPDKSLFEIPADYRRLGAFGPPGDPTFRDPTMGANGPGAPGGPKGPPGGVPNFPPGGMPGGPPNGPPGAGRPPGP
jgi:hypothetical protein